MVVWWVIETETDHVVGSAHTRKKARDIIAAHDDDTHHSHLKRVVMVDPKGPRAVT